VKINTEITLVLFGVPTQNAIQAVRAIRSFCCVGLKEAGEAVFMARNTKVMGGKWVSTHSTVGLLRLSIDKRFIGALFDRLVAARVWFTVETKDGALKMSSFVDYEGEEPATPLDALSWLSK
jgi:hypothetical protein